jgi:hypothetical protein
VAANRSASELSSSNAAKPGCSSSLQGSISETHGLACDYSHSRCGESSKMAQ